MAWLIKKVDQLDNRRFLAQLLYVREVRHVDCRRTRNVMDASAETFLGVGHHAVGYLLTASRMEFLVATAMRSSAPVTVRMSSTAKTFDGSAHGHDEAGLPATRWAGPDSAGPSSR